MNRQYRVIAGPYRIAKRYAESQGWSSDDFVIVTRGHQIARLDPAQISYIITVKLHDLSTRILDEMHHEIARVKALWPVPLVAA